MLRSLILLLFAVAGWAADIAPLLSGLAADKRPARLEAIRSLAATGDPRLSAFLEQYRQGSAYLWKGAVVVVPVVADKRGIPRDPLTDAPLGEAVPLSEMKALEVSGPERKAAVEGLNILRLKDPDPAVRLTAVIKAGDAGGDANRALLAQMQSDERDPKVTRSISEGVAIIDLSSADPKVRAAAATVLGGLYSSRAGSRLSEVAAKDADPVVRSAATAAVKAISDRSSILQVIQTTFSGLSAGSILVLMALGLSITFGLMGVINMAHGEMMMLGAYATLLVQWGFVKFLPAALLPWYFPIGVVAGFCAAAAAGWLLELLVIRHLYGRPLETLLATWGISYLLIQSIRASFGDNQAVTAPPWLVGGWEPVADLVLPWNRLFIIALTAVSVLAVVVLMHGTRLGLLLRATVQSRRTAASLGVDTRRIDGLTFAFGSGLAGAAGVGLTLIGGLKPDMGQEFIIDSFLVVATGGVGNLAGVCWAGFGLGIANKLLEPFTQAVFAKVLVLVVVIAFLQWRPQGIFPPKGRLADV